MVKYFCQNSLKSHFILFNWLESCENTCTHYKVRLGNDSLTRMTLIAFCPFLPSNWILSSDSELTFQQYLTLGLVRKCTLAHAFIATENSHSFLWPQQSLKNHSVSTSNDDVSSDLQQHVNTEPKHIVKCVLLLFPHVRWHLDDNTQHIKNPT